ncbi:hypothetical protein ACI51Z_06640 [Pectobacterium carotovorum]|uniref:hypothetical protein n=1 Tax=Pectobacterium TaxID=122277 RepID=UPI00208E45B0|nr:hypothetical protein [Pectobacterium versatile]MCO4314274.1 hypothetical protein [Pectobacterium versatile]
MFNKVIVCCPGNIVTGGPELLHQFVHEARSLGADASIMYYPFTEEFTTPPAYSHYDIKVASYSSVDLNNSIILLPEVATKFIKLFPSKSVCVWWLSVDNYFPQTTNKLTKFIRNLVSVGIGRKSSLSKIKQCINLSQSEYASLFLLKQGVSSTKITDYLNKTHLENFYNIEDKQDIIVFNPKKGFEVTKQLIGNNPDLTFIPIENMNAEDVRSLLRKSKIYIDFGNHPGKDRLPREAAMAGCCIITGTKGSACNDIDISIPKRFKFDDKTSIDNALFRDVVEDVFLNFKTIHDIYDSYRKQIRSEPEVFKYQVESFINSHVLIKK